VAKDLPVCGSRLKQARDDGRETCNQPRGFRTDHLGFGNCFLHGGRSQTGKQFAQKEAATSIMKTYGVNSPIRTDPVEGLLQEIARTAGHIVWLALQIGEIDQPALIGGEQSFTLKTGSEAGETTTVGPAVHVLLGLYLTERKHFASVCARAAAANIDERQVRLAEKQGELVGQILSAILDGLDLSDEQVEKVPGLIDEHLTLRVA
jgi:hypothetical protein